MKRGFFPRLDQPEWMDTKKLEPATVFSILKALETVNALLGGVRATLLHIERFARNWKPGERIRFIDWGTGGADLPRALVRWGRRNKFSFEVVGVDKNPAILEYARQACREYPEIQLVEADFDHYPAAVQPFDYAVSSLCLHHLREAEVVSLLRKSDEVTRRGMIMNDLMRDPRAWMWIWVLTRLFQAHPIVRHDAPLSVRRAFRPGELERLALAAELPYLEVNIHFGYRLTLAGEKTTLVKTKAPEAAGLKLDSPLIPGTSSAFRNFSHTPAFK